MHAAQTNYNHATRLPVRKETSQPASQPNPCRACRYDIKILSSYVIIIPPSKFWTRSPKPAGNKTNVKNVKNDNNKKIEELRL